MKLILIDGSSILSTGFYGTIPPGYHRAKTPEEKAKIMENALQSKGEYTNAVYSFCRTLLNLIENQQPTHIAVAWDMGRNTFRRILYPQYKANRPETPAELRSQYRLTQKLLLDIGIKQFMHKAFEADDFLGSLSSKFESQIPTYILTKDQDALQLVTKKTRLWLITSKACEDAQISPPGTLEFTPEIVQKVYGITTKQVIDKKALAGDTSDNIPGIRGIGDKIAVALLQEYGTLRKIFNAAEDATPFKETCKRLDIKVPLKKLRDGHEIALLSKRLATIVKPPVSVELEGLRLNINQEALYRSFKELDFISLIRKLDDTPNILKGAC